MGNEKNNGQKKEKAEEALLEELALLGNMMKLHEWTNFGQKEAEQEEELEDKLYRKAPPETCQPED